MGDEESPSRWPDYYSQDNELTNEGSKHLSVIQSDDDSASDVDSDSNPTTGDSLKSSSGDDENDAIAKNETTAVLISKRLVFVAIFLAAIGMGTLTYIFIRDDQQGNYEREVRDGRTLVRRTKLTRFSDSCHWK